MAKRLKYSGQGKAPSTLLRHVQNMYDQEISQNPRLVVKPFEECKNTVYLFKKENGKGIKNIFNLLRLDKRITYVIMLSGSNFFVTSRKDDLNFENLGLEIIEKSTLFTPIYTVPKGWNKPMNTAIENLCRLDFKKGLLPRTLNKGFSWDSLDWNIYNVMRANIRLKFSVVTRKSESCYNTVKNRFFKKILPSCIVAHYFYPKGLPHYQQLHLLMKTDYEKDLVNALEVLPCTSYAFPLEKSLFVVLFHEETDKTLDVVQKLEERAILDDYLLFNPLMYDMPD